jgi:hypothetical protein
MITTLLAPILSLLSGIASLGNKLMSFIRRKQDINTGVIIVEKDIAVKQIELKKKQDEILMTEQPKETTIKKLNNGSF